MPDIGAYDAAIKIACGQVKLYRLQPISALFVASMGFNKPRHAAPRRYNDVMLLSKHFHPIIAYSSVIRNVCVAPLSLWLPRNLAALHHAMRHHQHVDN